jgi:FAD-dependent urate hydroxylase
MNMIVRDGDYEAAVIGAGPYGLAAAAHLAAAGVGVCTFGKPMSFWREHMPDGMRMRSPWIATHIADPDRQFSLDVYAAERGFRPHEQMTLAGFVQYGDWFQRRAVPGLDRRKVCRLERSGRGFRLLLEDGHVLAARRVIVAMGLANQEFMPPQFAGLPPERVTHTADHSRLDKWRGKRVAVVGRGQSACESAALLRAAGSEVDLICRGAVHWIGAAPQQETARGWRWHARELLQSPSAVGPFPWSWFNEWPGLERRLPDALRSRISARSLRAAATRWVMPGFAGVNVLSERVIRQARCRGEEVVIELDDGVRTYDHVLLGTGYRIDIAKLGVLADDLIEMVARRDGSPLLAAGFESSVPGLHFVGASAVASYGPLLRFIAGSGYAARSVTRAVLAGRRVAVRSAERMSANAVGVGAAPRLPQP